MATYNEFRKFENQSDTEEEYSSSQSESNQEEQNDLQEDDTEIMDTSAPSNSTSVRSMARTNFCLTKEQRVWIIGQCFGDMREFNCFKIKKMKNDFKKQFGVKDAPNINAIHK